MESITPHYTSLGLLKFPDIVKLNTCMLFYDYFHHEKFPNIPVLLVSELYNYSTRSASSYRVAIPLFRANLRRFCPSIIGSFFWNDIPQSIRDKPSKKMFKKALLRWYLAQYYWINIPSITFWAILSFFSFPFLLIILIPLLYITLRGTILVYLDVLLSSPSNIQCNSI